MYQEEQIIKISIFIRSRDPIIILKLGVSHVNLSVFFRCRFYPLGAEP